MDFKPQTPSGKYYDFIIAGAGAAGLSLLTRMIASGKFDNKQILLVDKEPKINNDRTWCFWEKEPGFFESVVYKHWSSLWFHAAGFSKLFDIAPYRYKMIRGIDFYNHCFSIIKLQKNITVLYGNVQNMHSDENETSLFINDEKYRSDYIFNSIATKNPAIKTDQFYLLQHFAGWKIHANKPVFNMEQATLMDFRVPQHKGTAFVYCMPFSSNSALIEYTMFSEHLLNRSEYDENLKEYINKQLGIDQYNITDKEFGIIPMTNYRFPKTQNRIINLGTVGGQTKPSTGYTFQFIQKKVADILNAFEVPGNTISFSAGHAKYHFYDSVLLNVLATGKLPGDKVFTRMFSKNSPGDIFSFLDNESSFWQEMKIISSLQKMPFLKAGLQELL